MVFAEVLRLVNVLALIIRGGPEEGGGSSPGGEGGAGGGTQYVNSLVGTLFVPIRYST